MFQYSKNYLINSLLILSWASLVILYTFMYNWKQVKNVWKIVTESGNRPPSEPTGWLLLPMLLFIVEKLSHCFLSCCLDCFVWKRLIKKQLCIKKRNTCHLTNQSKFFKYEWIKSFERQYQRNLFMVTGLKIDFIRKMNI